jgi:hypothetical protein
VTAIGHEGKVIFFKKAYAVNANGGQGVFFLKSPCPPLAMVVKVYIFLNMIYF